MWYTFKLGSYSSFFTINLKKIKKKQAFAISYYFWIVPIHFEIFFQTFCGYLICKAHRGLFWQISFGNWCWWNNGWKKIFHTPLDFLDVKDLRKNIKGQRRSWRPNQGQSLKSVIFSGFFHFFGLSWSYLIGKCLWFKSQDQKDH